MTTPDWSKRWPDVAKMQNKDAKGVAHYPGWSMPALKYLYEEQKITASGHETTDTDPGLATTKDDYTLETYILSTNHYQIELLTNLDQVPEAARLRWSVFRR
jgi:kynurenine formamidase